MRTAAKKDANQDAIRLVLEGERPCSWNKFYSGMHWRKRATEADRVHVIVRAAIDPDTVQLFDAPAHITVTAYFKNRPLDPDNICAKLYVDGLTRWLIVDDSPQYVASVTTISRVDKARPRVEIVCEQAVIVDYLELEA